MFNAVKFLHDNFSDARALQAFLASYGVKAPPVDTVRKWFARGTIPADWLPVLLAHLELDRGAPVQLWGYISRGGPTGK